APRSRCQWKCRTFAARCDVRGEDLKSRREGAWAGGRIGTYVDKYEDLRTSGQTVVIDGLCASACTMVLGAVPHDRICVTSRAILGFHAAWDSGDNGREVTNRGATQMLYSVYPPQ